MPVTEPVVEWREANVEAMPFPDATFDVVTCQLGLQYFPNRPAAIREMPRVLAPSGRLALMVWRSLQHCPGYAVLTEVLDRHIGPEAGNIMRAPFSLGDREGLRTALSEGAFRDVVIRLSVGGRRRFFGIEQNPDTESRWAALARKGKPVMQFRYDGRYVANVSEGKVFRYPAWRALKLPE